MSLSSTGARSLSDRRPLLGWAWHMCPEGRRVFATLSVYDNLRYGCSAVGGAGSHERCGRVLQAFPRLAELLERQAGTLSGGEQQMLAVARGLMAHPRILMVDELSLGLSPKATTDISRTLLDLSAREGLSLLLVDQNIRLLRATCNRVYVLRDGVTRAASSTADIASLEAMCF